MIFNSSRGEIYYEIQGSDNSETIAFFHGLSTDHRMFDRLVPEFTADYQVIVWDMPWHGRSFKPESRFSYSVVADSFIELLNELEIQDVVLSGVSLGGYVVQYIADRHPERIKAVHIDGASPLHMNFGSLGALGVKINFILYKLLPFKIYKGLSLKMLTSGPESRQYLDQHFTEAGKESLIQLGMGNAAGIIRGIDRPLQQPVLLTNGEDETFVVKKKCARWNEASSNTQYTVIPGEGHLHIIDRPEAYIAALRSFLDGI